MSFLTWLSISLTTKRTGLSREPRFLYKVFRLAPCTCKLYIRCQGYPWTRAGRRRASCTKISRESQTLIYDQLHLHGNHTSSNSKSSLHFLHSFYLFTASDKGHFCITDNTLDVETRNILWCLFFSKTYMFREREKVYLCTLRQIKKGKQRKLVWLSSAINVFWYFITCHESELFLLV